MVFLFRTGQKERRFVLVIPKKNWLKMLPIARNAEVP